MMENEELVLDENGVPILTDIVSPEEADPKIQLAAHLAAMSIDEVAEELLASEAFQEQLDKVSAEISQEVRQHIAHTLRSAVEEAIIRSMEAGIDETHEGICRRIETALPGMLSRVLTEIAQDE